MPIRFAKRTNWELVPNTLIQQYELIKKGPSEIFDLTESNPTKCGFDYPVKEILAGLNKQENVCYDPLSKGMPQARVVVSEYYKEKGISVDPERIFLTSSTSEGYSYLFRLLVNPKEAILFPRPSYPLFEFLVDLNDVRMDYYPLNGDNQWCIDCDLLSTAFCPNTRAMVIVNPNNPTGHYVDARQREGINALCEQWSVPIICDEVFLDFAYEKGFERNKTFANNKDVLTFVLGGISKAVGLPQMKLSWIVINGPDGIVNTALERLEVIADTYLSVNTPVQNALTDWFAFRSEICEMMLGRICANREIITQHLDRIPDCQVLPAQGGWYAIVKLPDTLSEEEWALTFLQEDNTFVHPGFFYDFIDEPYAVISLLPAPDMFKKAVVRIAERIKNICSKGA